MVVDPTLQSKVQELTDEFGLEFVLLALGKTKQVTEAARELLEPPSSGDFNAAADGSSLLTDDDLGVSPAVRESVDE